MNNSFDHSQLNQLKLDQIKRKIKSCKGVTPIRKSSRLNKTRTSFAIKTNFLDDESYHGDSKDNDGPKKIGIEETNDVSYHGDLEDNENPKGEILEDLVQPSKNIS